ncbi:hypothetical protein DY218_34170 [Streptomyces triticagri]|uniref:Uncharacterized protein n=1 Tax=Streptomyces triticagri TaxID=2293568 RepID=A0A372LUH3_9ACTN|nr:hypothetical protein DY218_34170 [Streptomyces triticagri]
MLAKSSPSIRGSGRLSSAAAGSAVCAVARTTCGFPDDGGSQTGAKSGSGSGSGSNEQVK